MDQPGRGGQGVDDEAVFVDRYADHCDALRPQEVGDRRVAGFFDGGHVAGAQQDPGQQVDRVPGAVRDHDAVGLGGDPAGAGQPVRKRAAQLDAAGRFAVVPVVRGQAGDGTVGAAPPVGEREQPGVDVPGPVAAVRR